MATPSRSLRAERQAQTREQLAHDSAERFGLTRPMPSADIATAVLSLGVSGEGGR